MRHVRHVLRYLHGNIGCDVRLEVQPILRFPTVVDHRLSRWSIFVFCPHEGTGRRMVYDHIGIRARSIFHSMALWQGTAVGC